MWWVVGVGRYGREAVRGPRDEGGGLKIRLVDAYMTGRGGFTCSISACAGGEREGDCLLK